jgi:hypothetical protein
MLGLVLIYWVGRKFYDLADYHKRSQWGYTFVGLGIYFGTQLIFGMVLELLNPGLIDGLDKSSGLGLDLLGMAIGGLVWYLALQYFTKKWEQQYDSEAYNLDAEIEDIGSNIKSKD